MYINVLLSCHTLTSAISMYTKTEYLKIVELNRMYCFLRGN